MHPNERPGSGTRPVGRLAGPSQSKRNLVTAGSNSTMAKQQQLERVTNRRGPYTVAATDNGWTITIAANHLRGHGTRYSANWFAVAADVESVIVSCGQRIGKRLISRLDVRFARIHFAQAIEGLREFTIATVAASTRLDSGAWQVESEVPDAGKYLHEDATLMGIAYGGTQAEVTFLWVPSIDMHQALQVNREAAYIGPQPIVTVCLTTGQLAWLLLECGNLATTMQEKP